MEKLGLNEIRERYLSFFESKGHLRLPSFSLIPKNDPSILLINAGMTPMKPWFTGAEEPPRRRVTTCQKCIRTPDIERVGHTARHGTFFEMLGNFSFGDYFKHEIIPWAWEFCTEVMGMPKERLYVTVYQDDDEAYEIWHKTVGLDPSHIFRFGKEDNFWEHGIGPCGPCSEIFFDRGEKYGCGDPNCTVGCECDRFVEFWNLVFTQFNRNEDGSYTPLEHKNIDTGAGLERFAVIMQDVDNLFEVDTVRAILDAVCAKAKVEYKADPKTDIALRVITDHIRSTTFMISDGILPSNEGRGYVLRRLLRRAARYGRLLNIPAPFLCDLAELVIAHSGDAYPALIEGKERILKVIAREEESFNKTVQQGLGLLQELIAEAKAKGQTVLPGEEVFRLHDTFGFPLDLTREIAREAGLDVNEEAFNEQMQRQKAMGRKAQLEKVGTAWDKNSLPETIDRKQKTVFLGYEQLTAESTVLAILRSGEDGLVEVEAAEEGDEIILLFPETPFYAESGGQVGDKGLVLAEGAQVEIVDCTKTGDGLYLHRGRVLNGELQKGDAVKLEVNAELRMATARNHTTTHLLHRALRHVLGDHVEQAGSEVSPEHLRFDFRHFQAMTEDELRRVEDEVNDAILKDFPVDTAVMDLDEAKASGAMALFSEKYGDRVRVVSVGDYSRELCGGTHLKHSSQACFFRILSEQGVASGVRRIEAVTGAGAFKSSRAMQDDLSEAAKILKVPRQDLQKRLETLLAENKRLEKDLAKELEAKNKEQAMGLLDQVYEIGSHKILLAEVKGLDANALRESGDQLRDKLGDALIVLASQNEGKVLWLAMATAPAVQAGAHAGNLIKLAAQMTGGGGGGRPDMAQAGGKNAEAIPAALAALKEKIAESVKA